MPNSSIASRSNWKIFTHVSICNANYGIIRTSFVTNAFVDYCEFWFRQLRFNNDGQGPWKANLKSDNTSRIQKYTCYTKYKLNQGEYLPSNSLQGTEIIYRKFIKMFGYWYAAYHKMLSLGLFNFLMWVDGRIYGAGKSPIMKKVIIACQLLFKFTTLNGYFCAWAFPSL